MSYSTNDLEARKTVVDNLIEDLKNRERLGIERYGHPIRPGDKYIYPWMFMFLEEYIDGLIYYLAKLEAEYPEELAAWRKGQREL